MKIEGSRADRTERPAPKCEEGLKRKRPLNVNKRNDGVIVINLLNDDDTDSEDMENEQEDEDLVFVSERQGKKPKGTAGPIVKAEK